MPSRSVPPVDVRASRIGPQAGRAAPRGAATARRGRRWPWRGGRLWTDRPRFPGRVRLVRTPSRGPGRGRGGLSTQRPADGPPPRRRPPDAPALQPTAALVAARCLSRLGRPDQAEAHYQKAAPLDLEDLHIRALGLVVNNRREPAILAYREILETPARRRAGLEPDGRRPDLGEPLGRGPRGIRTLDRDPRRAG